jgi:transcriptional regulator with XRE-family HTH domain
MAELDRASIAARVKQAREEAGLTQPELGDAMTPSVHWRTIQTWESVKQARVPWDRLDEIARLTGRSKEWLVHGEDVTPPTSFTEVAARLEAAVSTLAAVTSELADVVRDLAEQKPPAQAAG